MSQTSYNKFIGIPVGIMSQINTIWTNALQKIASCYGQSSREQDEFSRRQVTSEAFWSDVPVDAFCPITDLGDLHFELKESHILLISEHAYKVEEIADYLCELGIAPNPAFYIPPSLQVICSMPVWDTKVRFVTIEEDDDALESTFYLVQGERGNWTFTVFTMDQMATSLAEGKALIPV